MSSDQDPVLSTESIPSHVSKPENGEDRLAAQDLELLSIFTEIRKRCLVSIGSVTTVEDQTIASLQEKAFALVTETSDTLKEAIPSYIGMP